MNRLTVFSLIMLSIITFFLGLNIGKVVQKEDTPYKIAVTKILITEKPKRTPISSPSATIKLLPTREVTDNPIIPTE